MTIPTSAIPGPEASAADVMAPGATAPEVQVPGNFEPLPDRSVSRNFLANLQHLASLKDKADLVQYGIMLMVEIATLEDRIDEAVRETTEGWRDMVVTARTARDKADALVDELRTENRSLAAQSTATPATLRDDVPARLKGLSEAIAQGHLIDRAEAEPLRALAAILDVARTVSMGLVQIGGHPARYRYVEEIRLDG